MLCKKKVLWVLEGQMRNWKQQEPIQYPREFTDAQRPEIALQKEVLWVLNGQMRNYN